METFDLKYNKTLYNNGPECFANVVNDKFESVHRMLFASALKKYFEDKHDEKYQDIEFDEFMSYYNIIEHRNKDYNIPSRATIRSKLFPFTQETIDLSKYWNEYQFDESNKDINELIDDADTLVDAKLLYVDYARNRCKFRSKTTGNEFWTTLDYVNKDTSIDDEYSLENTFAEKLKNI